MDTAFHPSFLTEIQLEHGPVDLIGRFLRYADALNRAQGVVLSFATLEELQDVNERNRESWKPLFPAFNPKLNTVPPDQVFCLLGRNADGEVVSAQAARLFTWKAPTCARRRRVYAGSMMIRRQTNARGRSAS